jgi:hypothetical protein
MEDMFKSNDGKQRNCRLNVAFAICSGSPPYQSIAIGENVELIDRAPSSQLGF